jgi:hypothetical protein
MPPEQQPQPLLSPVVLLTVIFAGGAGFLWLVWPSRLGVSPIWAVMAFALMLFGAYQVKAVVAISKTVATMEGNLLFVRRGDEEHDQVPVGVIDLAEPFDA